MILEAKNVLYSYKSKRDKIILKNVSATFEEATFYAIVGSSGSGKTTFLSLLAEPFFIMERIFVKRG